MSHWFLVFYKYLRMLLITFQTFMESRDDNQAFIPCSVGMSFSIKRMSSIYKIRNTTIELLTYLYMQGSSLFLMKPYILITLSKYVLQLQDAYLSP